MYAKKKSIFFIFETTNIVSCVHVTKNGNIPLELLELVVVVETLHHPLHNQSVCGARSAMYITLEANTTLQKYTF